MKNDPVVAIAGVTGAVGAEFIATMDRRGFRVGKPIPLASASSAGKTIGFRGKGIVIEELNENSFEGRAFRVTRRRRRSRYFAVPSQDRLVTLQKSWRSAPATLRQRARASSSACPWVSPIAHPAPGVPSLGSNAEAAHLSWKVITTAHRARAFALLLSGGAPDATFSGVFLQLATASVRATSVVARLTMIFNS